MSKQLIGSSTQSTGFMLLSISKHESTQQVPSQTDYVWHVAELLQ